MGYEQILVRITGKDRIGLTAAFMEILAKYDAQILDIGQADIHSTLSLGIFELDAILDGRENGDDILPLADFEDYVLPGNRLALRDGEREGLLRDIGRGRYRNRKGLVGV